MSFKYAYGSSPHRSLADWIELAMVRHALAGQQWTAAGLHGGWFMEG